MVVVVVRMSMVIAKVMMIPVESQVDVDGLLCCWCCCGAGGRFVCDIEMEIDGGTDTAGRCSGHASPWTTSGPFCCCPDPGSALTRRAFCWKRLRGFFVVSVWDFVAFGAQMIFFLFSV